MDTAQSLPLHNVHVVNFDERVRREAQPPWPQRVILWIHFLHGKLTKTNTGTPSDGLGGKVPVGSRTASVEGSCFGKTPASLYAASINHPEYRHYVEQHDEESDWSVDEVVVSGDEDNQSVPPISDPVFYPQFDHQSPDSLYLRLRWANLFKGAWVAISQFFAPTFPDKDAEIHYQKEQWHNNKIAAGYFSIFLVINWALYLWLNHSYGFFTLFTLPVPVMVAMNLNNKSHVLFQTWFAIATWYCALTEVIQVKECAFYTHNMCHGKDFLAMYYYGTGFPVIALFICARRSYAAVFQFVFFILQITLIIPNQGIYARNVIGFALFSMFVQWLSYRMEKSRRHLYQLNAQLKQAYFQLESSKQAEAQLSESRSLFAAYIFHEVRVPLNTAMLSFDSLHACGTLKKEKVKAQSFEVHALEVSLKQMQQVLNDVLDLQKMDTGLFEFKPRPFPFHRTLSHIFSHLNVAAAAKGVPLAVKFDANIDEVRLRPNSPTPDEGLWVIGDEIRLRQIITNLGSNAIKFTSEGGAVTIVTKLVQTPADRRMREEEDERLAADAREKEIVQEREREVREREMEEGSLDGKSTGGGRSTVDGKSTADGKSSTGSPQSVSMRMFKFRVEVQDQGPGLTPAEFRKLRKFQPFVQTNIGKNSGKGSGLGLPIVRQLVALSGGKMGVISRKGEGAVFWFELSFPVATQAEVRAAKAMMSSIPPPPSLPPSSPASLGTPTSPFAKPQAPFAFTSMASDTTVSTAFMQPFLPTPGSDMTESTLAGSPMSGKRLSMMDTSGTTEDGVGAELEKPRPPVQPHSRTPPPSLHPPPLHPPSIRPPSVTLPAAAQSEGDPLGATNSCPALATSATSHGTSPHAADLLQVPKATRQTTHSTAPVPSATTPAEEPLQVLVVDDEPLTGKIMARLLQSMGAKVVTATDGQQCVDILLGPPARTFDLVCLDNSMPVMTGLEAVRKLRDAGRLDFVVGCTGNALVTDQGEYRDAGADMILTKPLTRDRLVELLNIARYRRKHGVTGRYTAHAAL
ncbi:histidine kinase [Schizophyllum amplum]|uniref:histidine kinase n=1 Tax=Schizophyllum amplum TaxID=97359 RepID=A0A550CLH7_9AGAR|nr:histidine kinase [Auriculariopsis ampla]